MKLRTTVFIACALGLFGGGVRAQDPAALAEANQALVKAQGKLNSLEEEMIRAYRKLETDFRRLRGPGGDKLRTSVAEMVKEVAAGLLKGKGFEEEMIRELKDRLPTADLLSAPVADRFATIVAERIARFEADPADAARVALDQLFSSDDVDEIWDTKFIALPTVRMWRAANLDVLLKKLEIERLDAGGKEKVTPPEGMRLIPKGKFLFGPHPTSQGWPTDGNTAKRAQPVPLQAYYIDVHEVTNQAYAEFLKDQPEGLRQALTPKNWEGEPPTFAPGRELYPVTHVTFSQARAFADAVGKRLPTEAEWEKAARGAESTDTRQTPRLWPWGPEFDEVKHRDFLVWSKNRAGLPARILSRKGDLSPFLVSDMAGNVAEWTTTRGNGLAEIKGKVTDSDRVVIRGGSFLSGRRIETSTTWRWALNGADHCEKYVGFRCVLDESVWRRRLRARDQK